MSNSSPSSPTSATTSAQTAQSGGNTSASTYNEYAPHNTGVLPLPPGGPLLFFPTGSRGSFQMNSWPPDSHPLGSLSHRPSVDEISHFPSLSSDTEGGSHGGSFSGPSTHTTHGSGSISHAPFLGIPFFQDSRGSMGFLQQSGEHSQPLPPLSSHMLSSSHDSESDHIGGEPQRNLARSGWLYPPPPGRSSNEISVEGGTPLSPPSQSFSQPPHQQQATYFAPFPFYYPVEFRHGTQQLMGPTVSGMAMASSGTDRPHAGSISSVASTRSDVTEDTREDQDRPHEEMEGEYLSMQQNSPTGAATASSVQKMHLRTRHGQLQKVKQYLKQTEGTEEDDSEDLEEEYMEEDDEEKEEKEEEEENEASKLPQHQQTTQQRSKGKAPRGPKRGATTATSESTSITMRASQGGRGATAGTPTNSMMPASGAFATMSVSSTPERGHRGSGRKKIDIKPIPYKLKRQITFSKRKTGLLKKVKELTTLTQTDALVILVSETGNPHSYATKRFQDMIRNADLKTLNSFLDMEEKRSKGGKGH